MHIITAEGELVKGQELTPEESLIIEGLLGEDLNRDGYWFTNRDRKHIASYLIANFHISRRIKPKPNPEPKASDIILPPSPATQWIGALTPVLAELKAEENADEPL